MRLETCSRDSLARLNRKIILSRVYQNPREIYQQAVSPAFVPFQFKSRREFLRGWSVQSFTLKKQSECISAAGIGRISLC